MYVHVYCIRGSDIIVSALLRSFSYSTEVESARIQNAISYRDAGDFHNQLCAECGTK